MSRGAGQIRVGVFAVDFLPLFQSSKQDRWKRNLMVTTGSVLALHPGAGNCPYAGVEVELAPLGADNFGDSLRGKRGKHVRPLDALGRIGCACACEYGAEL